MKNITRYLEESLLKHVALEFTYDNIINERFGEYDGCKELQEYIYNKIKENNYTDFDIIYNDVHNINNIVCENQFVSVNKSTILLLRKLIGAIVRTANEFNIEITYYSPAQWRGILGINSGKSTDKKKKAYDYLIRKNTIDFEFIPKGVKKNDDVVDAICIGIAYIKDKGEM